MIRVKWTGERKVIVMQGQDSYEFAPGQERDDLKSHPNTPGFIEIKGKKSKEETVDGN